MRPKVVALAGGTGSAKLLRGLAALDCDLTVVANVGDNWWAYGAYVCPDVDIAMYTLAGVVDQSRGWGLRGDSYTVMNRLEALGEEAWFKLGDLDMATCMLRTARMAAGARLTEATSTLCRSFGVRQRVLPATDDPVETHIVTPGGEMHLQEFWVKRRGRPKVSGVRYHGARSARPTAPVRKAMKLADRVVFCPANPITSIGPILALDGMKDVLRRCGARKVALSPMVGSSPVSGPAGKLLRACGVKADSEGVAGLYSGIVDAVVIDRKDRALAARLSGKMECKLSDIVMRSPGDEKRLAREVLEA